MAQILLLNIGQFERKRLEKQRHQRKYPINNDIPEENPLCRFCSEKGIWDHLSTRQIIGPEGWIHGFISDPQEVKDPQRLKCAFCRTVFEVLPETAFAEEHRHNYERGTSSITYCDLRPVAIKFKKEIFTSFVVVYNFLEYVSHSRTVFSNYRAWVGLGSAARSAVNTPGIAPARLQDTLNPRLIRSWIDRCRRHHAGCNEALHRFASRARPTMMIDVQRMCLVEADTSWPYAALSYVWGQVQTLRTTKASLETFKTPGALRRDDLWNQMPQAIQDCILLTQSINLPYLWVDCLCIVQDDIANKYGQIATMDTIYFQARVTIIPLSNKNADDALPGVRPGTRPTTSTLVARASEKSVQRRIVPTLNPGWHNLTRDSVYETRAWTFQEKILSIRCLFISRWGMWFQCLTSRYSDVEAGELPLEPENSADLSLLNLATPEHLSSDNWDGWDQARIDEFLSFAMHVEWYSGRNLTFPEDRIDAFRGILNKFEDHCQQEFLWGHPDGPLFEISLLWIHGNVGRSRDAVGSLDDNIRVYQDYLPDRDRDYPTWSWTGWSGKASFRLILDMEQADLEMRLDENVEIVPQLPISEEEARSRMVPGFQMDPPLFHRWINSGYLEVTGPTISCQDMCCGRPSSLLLDSLDEVGSIFVLAHRMYPFSQENSLMTPEEEMEGAPCGMVFGIPFWKPEHYEQHYFVLLKTVPGRISALFKNHANFRSMFEKARGRSVCIAMLVWATERYAERTGIAILDQTFWENRNPVLKDYTLM